MAELPKAIFWRPTLYLVCNFKCGASKWFQGHYICHVSNLDGEFLHLGKRYEPDPTNISYWTLRPKLFCLARQRMGKRKKKLLYQHRNSVLVSSLRIATRSEKNYHSKVHNQVVVDATRQLFYQLEWRYCHLWKYLQGQRLVLTERESKTTQNWKWYPWG